jgi:hypothetical protein
MSNHENIEAVMDFYKLNNEVLFNNNNKKVIWQPRIDAWYRDRTHKGIDRLPERYKGMSLRDIYLDLGCSNRIYDFNECFSKVYDSTIKHQIIEHNEMMYEEIFETPVGRINQLMMRNESNHGIYPKKWFIETKEDFIVQIWIEEHTSMVFDEDKYNELLDYWQDLGAPQVFIDRVNVQKLFLELMGVTNAIYAIFDYPEVVENYFEVLEKAQTRWFKVYNDSPIRIINYGDNIHNGTLPPALFKKYVLPAYQRRSKLWNNKFIFAHWDGDTKHILKFAKDTTLDGIEAITPKPQGDVTLDEMKEHLGDLFLIDGIPAILFDDIYPVETLIETTKKIIQLFAPNLVLGISDEISSTGDIERVRIVGRIVDEYNQSVEGEKQ